MNDIILTVPAYNPPEQILTVINELTATFACPIVIVNDGSTFQYHSLFTTLAALPNVTLLKHAVNLGKGAALKTAFNHILCNYPECKGVVTLDADGQHKLEDIKRVFYTFKEQPASLVLGARTFEQDNVPLKNRFGNILTRSLFRIIHKRKLNDTQTGLRAIPTTQLGNLLKLPANGYEFELKMLIQCLLNGCNIEEVAIETVYLNKNASSHFRPIVDSFRILKALLQES
jgi:glycosyltransferase involved in cell wall biosynthesis